MRLNHYQCDICKNQFPKSEILELTIPTNREMDASGNGYVQNYQYKDICVECSKIKLNEYFINLK